MKLFSKLLTLIIKIFHPNLSGRKRWFLKLYYSFGFNQIRFFVRDYITRTSYKHIEFEGEFAPELKFVIPFAYWHYKNGTLKSSCSSKDTAPFYFFSPNHRETKTIRKWNDHKFDISIPNSFDHGIKFDYAKWEKIPFADHYRPQKISFEKPTLVISNKYNNEWGGPPVNFLSTNVLRSLFDLFSKDYQIVYNRPAVNNIVQDNSEVFDLADLDLLEKYPSVYSMNKLFNKFEESSFNKLQLRIYAGCNRFISVQGGNSVLASYFEGDNVIFATRGLEIEMNEYETIYPKLSNARIHHVDSYNKLIERSSELYLVK